MEYIYIYIYKFWYLGLFNGIFPIFGGFRAEIKAKYPEEVGMWPPTQIIFKTSFFAGSEQQNDEYFVKSKPFLCREVKRVDELWRPVLGVMLHLY